jgi:integrase
MKRRRKHIGCSVLARDGYLRLRFRWEGKRYARVTKLPDTADNRAQLEKLATLIAATIAAGRDPRPLLETKEQTSASATRRPTVQAYFDIWIADKVSPMVRKAQERDYRRHIEGYVLPQLGDLPIADLSARDILGLRAQLLQRGLSLKYVKNILGASFKAMIRDAREIDRVVTVDPFVGVRWGRVPVAGPEPFTAAERTMILRWFEQKQFAFRAPGTSTCTRRRPHPPYYVYVHTLFWTGMRPSEVSGLRWSDVDLDAGIVRVVRSRHMWEESAPKTGPSARTVELLPETSTVVRSNRTHCCVTGIRVCVERTFASAGCTR